jgi:DNA-binding transcriptional ArsR family regulator
MRNSSATLAPFFNPLTQRVLAATVLRPEHEWYLSDLASHLSVGPSSLQRILAKLTDSGLLVRREDGNRVYYRVDSASPIFGELAAILVKTVGIAEPIRDALTPLAGKIRVAFIHGSVAEGRQRTESDVDLIVIGDVSGLDLTAALVPLHDRLGRQVNFSRYTVKEFTAKLAASHHFLTSVLAKKRVFLIGDEHELDEVAGRKAGGAGANKQAGT